METLTQENFWNKMKEDYPKAMDKFYTWLDKYKKENNWKQLFGTYADTGEYPTPKKVGPPRYHDLPLAMQVGIFDSFVNNIDMDEKAELYTVKNNIEETLDIIEDNIKRGVKGYNG